jgi:3-phenylpropionate/trans-cinnamate dioxygenase ferredoxin subunit
VTIEESAPWRKLCALAEMPDGCPVRLSGATEKLAAVRVNDEVFVVSDRCTHAEASLSEGEVDTDELTVECPRHGAAFDLRTGEALTLPATRPVRSYSVEIRGDEVWVDDGGQVGDGGRDGEDFHGR